MAYSFQTGSNEIKLPREFESGIQKDLLLAK
jgi:hypothetical protein